MGVTSRRSQWRCVSFPARRLLDRRGVAGGGSSCSCRTASRRRLLSTGDRRSWHALPAVGVGQCAASSNLEMGVRRSGNLRPTDSISAGRRFSRCATDGRPVPDETVETARPNCSARGPHSRLAPPLAATGGGSANAAELVAAGAGTMRRFTKSSCRVLSERALRFSATRKKYLNRPCRG